MKTVRQMLHGKSPLISVSLTATVFDALALMAQHDVGALVVLEEGRLAGMFSERDYARKVILHGKSSKDTPVGEIISHQLCVAAPDSTIEECMRLMTTNRVRHLPVLEGEALAGLVSIGDLVNYIISAQSVEILQLQSYITGQYPG